MSPAPSHPDPADHATQRDEDAQYYREVLHELVEIGARLARAIDRQANAEPAAAPEQPAPAAAPDLAPKLAPDFTIAFDRVARTIRRTIALARRISDPAAPRPAAQAAERRRIARKQIIRDVEDTIQRETSGADADALHAEFYERLETIDMDDDLDNLPIAELIALIRRDLGLAALPGTHPWKRRTPADVRDLCARAAGAKVKAKTGDHAASRAADWTRNPRSFPPPPPRTRPGTGPPQP